MKNVSVAKARKRFLKCQYKQIEGSGNYIKLQKDAENRVENFKKLVREGPYYFCVVCNRCLYKRSVVLFNDSLYNIESSHKLFSSRIQSFDGSEYICAMCDLSQEIKNKTNTMSDSN